MPSLPRVLAEAKSYAEQLFVFERIEHLTEDVARRALTEPAAIEGVAWDDDAITFVVAETSGYPYFLQQFGQDTWNDAPGPRSRLPMPESVQRADELPSTTASSAFAGTARPEPSSGTCARWRSTETQAAHRAM